MIGLYVDHVHPDIPFPEGAVTQARIGCVVDLEYKVRDQLGKQAARGF
jgi:hypothetical protein